MESFITILNTSLLYLHSLIHTYIQLSAADMLYLSARYNFITSFVIGSKLNSYLLHVNTSRDAFL